jgi:S1-C subfamily serine protease
MRTLACLLIATAALAAPVPKMAEPPPDPLGHGYMGVRVQSEGTLQISSVEPNTPASAAGLRAGDIFVRVGPLTPQTFDEVREMIGSLRPGTRIDVVYLREKRELTTAIVLADRPANFGNVELLFPQP